MEARELKEKASQLFTKGKFAKAAETYEECCALDKKDHQARLRCGDAWAKAGKKDKAVGAYALAAEGFARDGFLPRAIAASKLVLDLDPSHKAVQKMLAELYAQKRGAPRPAGAARGPSPSVIPSAPAAAAAPEMEISRGVSAPVTSSFSTRTDAIDLDGPVAAKKPAPQRPEPEAPSPMRRADALELPEYEIPMEDTGHSVGGMSAKDGPSPERRTDAIAVEDDPSPGPQRGQPALTETAIEIELAPGVASTGEVEIAIEGQPLPDAPQLPPELQVGTPLAPGAPAAPSVPVFELTVEVGAPAPLAAPPATVEVPLPPSSSSNVYELTEAVGPPAPSAPAYELTDVDEPPPALASLPPGLKVKRPEPAAPASATPTPSRIWIPPSFTPAPPRTAGAAVTPAASSAAPAPAPVAPSTDLERSLQTFMQFEPDGPAPRAAAPMAAVTSFTELDLDDSDSLLQAVEAAAHAAASAAAHVEEEAMEVLEETKLESGALPKIPLFSDLPEEAFIALFEQCPLQRFDEGQLVFEQGDKADAFYVVCGGKARVFRSDGGERRDLAMIEEGSFFGEMALLSEAPRSASVEAAVEDTQVLVISSEILAELSSRYPVVGTALKKFCRQRMLTNLVNTAPLFAPFNLSDRRELVQKFRASDVKRGDVIVTEGKPSDGMYVILSGEVEVSMQGSVIAVLKEGQVFGEMSLLDRGAATATVRALRHTSLLRLPKQDFNLVIMSHPQVLEHVSALIDDRRRNDQARESGLL